MSHYIELNPDRAGMVNTPSAYKWSSHEINGMGKESELCTPYALYLAIEHSAKARQLAYRVLFKAHVDGALLVEIRDVTNKGLVTGNEHFKKKSNALASVCVGHHNRLIIINVWDSWNLVIAGVKHFKFDSGNLGVLAH